MNDTALLECMNAIPLEWIEECENASLPKNTKILPIAAASTACVCVAAGILFACGVFAKPEPTLVTVENSIGDYLAGSLARFPYPGEMWYSLHLSSDIHSRESTDGLVYYVEIIFATKEEHINMNKEKTAAECKHLASLGYELYIQEKDWIGYWGEDKHYSTVCGVLSVEQMEALAEVSNYGCYLDFAMGDIENYTRVEAN